MPSLTLRTEETAFQPHAATDTAWAELSSAGAFKPHSEQWHFKLDPVALAFIIVIVVILPLIALLDRKASPRIRAWYHARSERKRSKKLLATEPGSSEKTVFSPYATELMTPPPPCYQSPLLVVRSPPVGPPALERCSSHDSTDSNGFMWRDAAASPVLAPPRTRTAMGDGVQLWAEGSMSPRAGNPV